MIFLMMLSVTLLSTQINTTLYSKCEQTSDLWQQLELAFELESDIRDTADWSRKWLVDFNGGKTRLTGLIALVLLMGLFLREIF